MSDLTLLRARLKVWPQYLLPQRLLTAAAHRISNSAAIARPMIAGFRRIFPVEMSECVEPKAGFATFDAFFTRALRDGGREWPGESSVIACPCDGRLSQLGSIRDGRIFQAKRHEYSAAELLGDRALAESFRQGHFATLYLAPHDYHRVHMPFDGRLLHELRVPGRLFSVSTATTSVIDGLFARNERMVAIFETDFGPAAVVMVAAMLVAGIETVWNPGGRLRPAREVQRFDFDFNSGTGSAPKLARGAELGRFHWGSTVILLTPPSAPDWLPTLAGGQRMRVGQPMSAADS